MASEPYFTDGQEDFRHAERKGDSAPGGPGQVVTPWQVLVQGKTVGKRAIALFDSANVAQAPSMTDILTIGADDDRNAHQLCLTLSPPQVVTDWTAIQAAPDKQGVSGEVENLNMSSGSTFAWGNVLAILDWGIGGIANQAVVDFSNGLCVNLCASYLRVRAVVDRFEFGALEPLPSRAAYVFRAFVGPGYPKSNNAQRTVRIQVGDGQDATSGWFQLPAFAKDVTVLGVQKTAGISPSANQFSCLLQFANAPAAANVQSQLVFDQDNPIRIPVPNDSPWFRIVNTTTAVPASVTHAQVVFNLAI